MLKNKGKLNALQVNKDKDPIQGSSRFIIDLKQPLDEKGVGHHMEYPTPRASEGWINFYDRLAEFGFRGAIKTLKHKNIKALRHPSAPVATGASRADKNISPPASSFTGEVGRAKTREWLGYIFAQTLRVANFFKIKDWRLPYEKRLSRLALFSLLKFVAVVLWKAVKLFYKICFRIGWIVVFFIRFIYFASLALIRPVVKFSIIGANKIKAAISFLNRVFLKFWTYAGNRSQSWALKAELKMKYSAERLKRVFIKKVLDKKESEKVSDPSFREERGGYLIGRKLLPRPGSRLLRPTFTFAAFLLILILPLKAFTYYKSLSLNDLRGKVLGASHEALNDLAFAGREAGELNFSQARENFSAAADKFLKAENELRDINGLLFILASIVPSKDARLAAESKNILAAGRVASILGGNLSISLSAVFDSEDGAGIKDVLDIFVEYGSKAADNARDLREILMNINVINLPEEYREQFILIQQKGAALENGLRGFVDLVKKTRIFLGMDQDKRYLLVFQNNAELRATGGFIGSFALVDFRAGKIKNIETPAGGSYDTEAGLREKIISPEPLHLISPLWYFWDANWWPDWPTSAKKLMWFYERSAGPTVDGVISLTPNVIEGILEAIGPIDMTEKYGVIINADNFWTATRKIIEESNEIYTSSPVPLLLKEGGIDENGTKDKPKKIIGDLMAKIIEELPKRLSGDSAYSKLMGIIKTFEKSLNEKHILFYFADKELQEKARAYGWDGKIRQTSRDYLLVVNTNIAGGKTDRKIKQIIEHSAEVMPDGSIIDTVKIERSHIGVKNEPFFGVRNVNWMRIYVPKGSQLLEAQGFSRPDEIYFKKQDGTWAKDAELLGEEELARIHAESGTKIYEEAGKTVFANWSMVDPGKTITIYLKYKLPFKLKNAHTDKFFNRIGRSLNPGQKKIAPYALLAQKQSGTEASIINSTLKLPGNFKVIWKYPKEFNVTKNGWKISDSLERDKYWAVIVEH